MYMLMGTLSAPMIPEHNMFENHIRDMGYQTILNQKIGWLFGAGGLWCAWSERVVQIDRVQDAIGDSPCERVEEIIYRVELRTF